MAETSEQNAKNPKAQSFFQYGNDAAMKNNFDYAIDMYRSALKLDQGNLLYRQALRGVQRRTFGNEPSRVGRMVGMKTKPMKAALQATKARGKWIDVLEGAEDIFRHNPWDIGAAETAADAAEHLGLGPLSQWLLESVVTQAGDNEAFFLRLAHAYEINQKWEQAISCWERAHRINPANEESKRKVNSLSASASIARSGLGAAIEKADEDRAGSAKRAAEAEADELKRSIQTPEQRLEKELEEDPSRIGQYLQLADMHKTHNRLDDAEKVLARGRKANPDDEVLKTAHGDIQLSRLRRAIDAWTKKLKDNPGDKDAKEKLAQIREKLSTYELAEFRRRAEGHPEDAALHLHYGRLLATAGKHDEAIAAFQKARSDPELKPKALHAAGLSFQAKGLVKLAEKNVAEALTLSDPGNLAYRNELRYDLGRLCEAQNKFKEAEEFYNEVAAEDYTYKDVAARLQALNDRDDS
jgi:tetratricopeptide (TPR) repeat protein